MLGEPLALTPVDADETVFAANALLLSCLRLYVPEESSVGKSAARLKATCARASRTLAAASRTSRFDSVAWTISRLSAGSLNVSHQSRRSTVGCVAAVLCVVAGWLAAGCVATTLYRAG